MSATPETMLRDAAAKLRAGDAKAARALLDTVVTTPLGQNAQVRMMLADACRQQGDFAAFEAAADAVLAIEPRAVRAHIWKADCRTRAGDERAASAFYASAVGHAEASTKRGTTAAKTASY